MVGAFFSPQASFYITEHDSVYFANAQHPPAKYNNAYCKVGIFFVLLASLPRISFSKISRVSLQILQNNVNLNNHSLGIGYYKI